MYTGTISSIGQMRSLRSSITVVSPFRTGRYLKKQQLGYFFYLFAESIIKKYEILDSYGFDAAVLLFLYNLHKEAEEHEKLKTCVEQTLRLLVLWNGQNEVENQIVCRQNVFLSNLKNEIELNLSFIRELNIHQYNSLNKLYGRESAQQNLLLCKALISNLNSSEITPAGTSQSFEDLQINKVTNTNFTNTIGNWKTIKPCSLSNSFRTILENVAYISHPAGNRELFYSSVKNQMLTNFFTQHLSGGSPMQNRYSKSDTSNPELIYNISHTGPEPTVLSNVNVDEINKYYSILSAGMSVFNTVEGQKHQLNEYRQLSEDEWQIVNNILSNVNYRELRVILSNLQCNIRSKTTGNILSSINTFSTVNNIGQKNIFRFTNVLQSALMTRERTLEYLQNMADGEFSEIPQLITSRERLSREILPFISKEGFTKNKLLRLLKSGTSEEKVLTVSILSFATKNLANIHMNDNRYENISVLNNLLHNIESNYYDHGKTYDFEGDELSLNQVVSHLDQSVWEELEKQVKLYKTTVSQQINSINIFETLLNKISNSAGSVNSRKFDNFDNIAQKIFLKSSITKHLITGNPITKNLITKNILPGKVLFSTGPAGEVSGGVFIKPSPVRQEPMKINLFKSFTDLGIYSNISDGYTNNLWSSPNRWPVPYQWPSSVVHEERSPQGGTQKIILKPTLTGNLINGKFLKENLLREKKFSGAGPAEEAPGSLKPLAIPIRQKPAEINLFNKHAMQFGNSYTGTQVNQPGIILPANLFLTRKYSPAFSGIKYIRDFFREINIETSPQSNPLTVIAPRGDKNSVKERDFARAELLFSKTAGSPAMEGQTALVRDVNAAQQDHATAEISYPNIPIVKNINNMAITQVKKTAAGKLSGFTGKRELKGGRDSVNTRSTANPSAFQSGFIARDNKIAYFKADIVNTGQESLILNNKTAIAPNDIDIALNNMAIAQNNMAMTHNDIDMVHNNMAVKHNDMAVAQNNMAMEHNDMAMKNNDMAITQNNIAMTHNDIDMVQNNMAMKNNDMAIEQNNMAMEHNDMAIVQNNMAMTHNDIDMVQNNMTMKNNDMAIEQNNMAMAHNGMVFHDPAGAGKKERQYSAFQTPSQNELISRFGNLIADPNLPPPEFSGRQTGSILSNPVPGGSADFSRKMLEKLTQEEQSNKEEQRRMTELTQKLTEQETVIYKLQHAYAQLQEDMAKGINVKKITTLVMKELRDRLKLEKMRYGVQ